MTSILGWIPDARERYLSGCELPRGQMRILAILVFSAILTFSTMYSAFADL